MNLSIITVNTNGRQFVLDQIASVIKGASNLSFEHIVSDNGSTDGSVEQIKNQFPNVKIIENGQNIGFGAANNSALKNATGEFILFLNPDMRVLPNSLEKMVAYMRGHKDVGIASCKLIDEQGNFSEDAQPRRFPKLLDQLVIVLKISKLFPTLLNSYLYKGFNSEKEQEVDSVRGSFMLTRRDITDRLGWAFDPRYFIWFEDVDLCKEVKKMELKIMYTPIISCIDYVGQTFKRQPSVQKQKWFTKSMVEYFKKWEPCHAWMLVSLARPVGIALTWFHSRVIRGYIE